MKVCYGGWGGGVGGDILTEVGGVVVFFFVSLVVAADACPRRQGSVRSAVTVYLTRYWRGGVLLCRDGGEERATL